MIGGVYRISILGDTDDLPHPHVVVLEMQDDCLLIPAFSPGGPELERRLELLKSQGLERNVVSVEMDNALHVNWIGGFQGKRSCWFVFRFALISKRIINSARKLGQMDDSGVLKLLLGLLRLSDARPELFAKKRVKRIKEMVKLYQQRCGSPPTSS